MRLKERPTPRVNKMVRLMRMESAKETLKKMEIDLETLRKKENVMETQKKMVRLTPMVNKMG